MRSAVLGRYDLPDPGGTGIPWTLTWTSDAARVNAPVIAASHVLADTEERRRGDGETAALLPYALVAPHLIIRRGPE
jgi:hypothetical protein